MAEFDPKLPFGLARDPTADPGVPIPITIGGQGHAAVSEKSAAVR
jgi:hypothetical protein